MDLYPFLVSEFAGIKIISPAEFSAYLIPPQPFE
jgi:hypothetical protein